MKPIEETVRSMRSMAKFLMPHTFPLVPPEEENDVNYFKTRDATVDGYEVVLTLSRASYKTHYLESFQVSGKYVPFLPFRLVCKLARKFLGDQHLGFVDFFAENKRKYCWTLVLDQQERPINSPYENRSEHRSFDGLEYDYMDPKQVNFY
jgi:hypothetical protein